jgi:hypothetical protein|uniref:hypothetical protein n=1 Tax=Cephaloticoccus sp. TaxID=1985742 RepID=UPI00404AEA7E
MKLIPLILTLLLLLVTLGCANSEVSYAIKMANREALATGLPFRLHAETINGESVFVRTMIDVPHGPTLADAVLKTDVLALIKKLKPVKDGEIPQLKTPGFCRMDVRCG